SGRRSRGWWPSSSTATLAARPTASRGLVVTSPGCSRATRRGSDGQKSTAPVPPGGGPAAGLGRRQAQAPERVDARTPSGAARPAGGRPRARGPHGAVCAPAGRERAVGIRQRPAPALEADRATQRLDRGAPRLVRIEAGADERLDALPGPTALALACHRHRLV